MVLWGKHLLVTDQYILKAQESIATPCFLPLETCFPHRILYLISPYDCAAHVGQAIIGTQTTYDQYSWTYSLVALVAMNALALYVLSSRVASMEVTRE